MSKKEEKGGMERTQNLSEKAFETKSIPTICESCGEVYRMETIYVPGNQEAGVKNGICPRCKNGR